MKRIVFILILCFSIGPNLYGQELKRSVYGIVTDARTFKPIPYVYVLTSLEGAVTNIEGLFSIWAQDKDTIRFSHIGYHQTAFSLVSNLTDSVRVILIPREKILDEVVIHDYPALDFFKKQVLETRVIPPVGQINAENNLNNAKMYYLSGYRPSMNAYDNYWVFMEGPQPVTFFSSNPSKGLFRAIKNFSKNNSSYNFRPSVLYPNTDPLWLKQNLYVPDSLINNK